MAGKMHIDSYENAGRLFIALAKGERKLPETTKQAVILLADFGIKVEDYENVVFHVNDSKTLHLVVPSKEDIAKSETEVGQEAKYTFPHEHYKSFYLGSPPPRPSNEEMFRIRIGDYTLGKCK